MLLTASCCRNAGDFTAEEKALINRSATGIETMVPEGTMRVLTIADPGRVMELIDKEGWHVVNADITIAMQRPKLAPYIIPMRECLSGIMQISPSRVSVKATTTEKLGFVGRGEGCEVYAVVLLGRYDEVFD